MSKGQSLLFGYITCTDLIGDVFDRTISAGAEAHSQGVAVTAILHPILQELLLAWRSRPQCAFTCMMQCARLIW